MIKGIKESFNKQILDYYVKLNTDTKYSIMTYGTYALTTVLVTQNSAFAAAGGGTNILDAAKNLITDLQTTIISLSTAAAVCGVGYGAFLKKFSLGRMDRLDMGNKLITNSIWGWVIINGVTAILNFAGKYIGAQAQ